MYFNKNITWQASIILNVFSLSQPHPHSSVMTVDSYLIEWGKTVIPQTVAKLQWIYIYIKKFKQE